MFILPFHDSKINERNGKKMTGGTRKRGKTWYYYFDLGKVNGKRQKKEKGGFKTQKEAEAALIKAMAEYNSSGSVFEPSEITVADHLDQWLDLYCKINLKYGTLANYSMIIKQHLKPKFGSYKLKALTASMLQEYANSLKLKGYSRSYIYSVLSVLENSLNYAINPLHYLSVNPMIYVKYPKVEKKPRQRFILSLADWQRILEMFPAGSCYYIPLMIGFYTGLRISEAFALTWNDIDFEKREITVNKQVIRRKKGNSVFSSWCISTPKSKSSERIIKFGETLYQALKAERTAQLKNELKHSDQYIIHVLKSELDEKGNMFQRIESIQKSTKADLPRIKLICIDNKGKYIPQERMRNLSVLIREKLSININYHSLRHTHATLLIEAGADVKDVQARLGHNNIQTTLQTYVHDTEAMAAKSVELFEQAVSKIG